MKIKEKHLKFLDSLRKSGATNMLGAGQFLEAEFNINKKDAMQILVYWMKNFKG